MNQKKLEEVNVYNFYADKDEWRVVYQKLIISALLPIFICASAHCSWWVILKIQKKPTEELFTKFAATTVLLLFLVHPSIT